MKALPLHTCKPQIISVSGELKRGLLVKLPEELKYKKTDTHIILLADSPQQEGCFSSYGPL